MANPNAFPVEQEAEAMQQTENLGPAPEHAPPIAIEIQDTEQGAEAITVKRLSAEGIRTLGSKVKEFVSIPDEAGVIGAYDANRAGTTTTNPNARVLAQQRARNRREAQGPDFTGQRKRGDH